MYSNLSRGQAIGKTVSVTYQPRKDKTGIKKIVLAECETIQTIWNMVLCISEPQSPQPNPTQMYWDNSVKHFEADENVFNKYETFSDMPPPTTTSRPTTGSGAVSTGYNVCFVDLMYTIPYILPSVSKLEI